MSRRPTAFDRQPHHRARGRVAEDEGVAYLERRGYKVVARNVVTRAGEIDLVARHSDTLCFVEIKARRGASHGLAVDAVPAAKQRRIARAAALHLARHGSGDEPCRFDVLAMDRQGDGWTFTLVQDAFQVD